jgi:hypothetical protein
VAHKNYSRPPRVSEKLDVTLGTLANWRTKRVGPPFYRVGGLILYDDDEIDQWVARGRQITGNDCSPATPSGASRAQASASDRTLSSEELDAGDKPGRSRRWRPASPQNAPSPAGKAATASSSAG